jgi:hypothetical protein
MIDSWIFWELNHALEWAEHAAYPVVFKLKKGAGSRNVILTNNKTEAKRIINRMFGKGISSSHGIPHKGIVKYKNLESHLRHKADQYFLNKFRGLYWKKGITHLNCPLPKWVLSENNVLHK